MVSPVNNKIIVSVDLSQKDSFKIEGNYFKLALKYEKNYRYRSPVIATVVHGNDEIRDGDILLCHHNLYYLPSPFHLYGKIYSVPFSKVLFAKILPDGELFPICGNILGDRIDKEEFLPLPPEQREKYNDRIIVTNAGYHPKYKKGDLLITRPSACYNIEYNWNYEQRTVTKISDDQVCGIVR